MRSEPPAKAQALAAQVERDGGTTLALYQEPLGDHWQIFCLLPRERVEASPYQRDLSPTHVKRLTETIKRLDRFVDPIVVISPKPGVYWTPNGNHRRAVLDKLRADSVPAILVVEPAMVFEVLPLNVEKAHNLKEKSLEVIRMYRALAAPVRVRPLHHARPPLRGEQAVRGRGVRADPATRGQVPEAHAVEGARGAPGARRTRPRGRRGAGRGRGEDQEARHQPPVREELRAGPHHAPHPGAQDAAAVRADLQEAPREPRGVRHLQGALRRDPALRDHGGSRADRVSVRWNE